MQARGISRNGRAMLLSILLTCMTALTVATVLLFIIGHRVHGSSPVLSVALGAVFTVVMGEVAARFWLLPSTTVVVGEIVLFVVVLGMVLARPLWNPVGQLFLGSLVATAVAYLALAGWATVGGRLSPVGAVASTFLWMLEVAAFVIAVSFAFESCDVVCRSRWTRPVQPPDPDYRPKVSLHVPAYAEPPEMLIETIASLEAIEYPDFEIVVIDNNTAEEALWRPVEEYCAGRDRVRFVHVNPWPGYKSGALNLALRSHTSPDAELVGVVDADYLVRPDYLERTVGYFADPSLAFLQTPQDYRDWESDRYLTACYDAYRYFFETAMPSRNERDSIIFGGTMGLIRRPALDAIGGWDERCITEDAEASLRILRAGNSGLYLNESFGQGIMPLTFGALKRQMFRWCFGGIQILRRHHRSLMPWDRDPDNHLSLAQRMDYLLGGLQWFGNLVGLGFTAVLVVVATLLALHGKVVFAPVMGAAVLVPITILLSGLLRAVWALHHLACITYRRAVLAFVAWLSLAWTIGLACLQGIAHFDGVFLRTPKWQGNGKLREALRSSRVESLLAAAAWSLAAVVLAAGGGLIIGALFIWQGAIYAASPTMAWLNQRSHLSARLERVRRAEERRDRLATLRPHVVRGAVGVSALAALILLLATSIGAGRGPVNLFAPPRRTAGDRGPLGNLGLLPDVQPSPLAPRGAGASSARTGGTGTSGSGGSGSATPGSGPNSGGSPGSGGLGTSPGPATAGTSPTTTTIPSGSTARTTTSTVPTSTTTTTSTVPTTTTTTHPGASTTTPSTPASSGSTSTTHPTPSTTTPSTPGSSGSTSTTNPHKP